MDKLTAIKIKYDDGTYSDEIPISVLSENVEWDSTHTLVDVLGSINVDVTGTIQDQISQLFNEKVSNSDMQTYITNSMPTYITTWLNTNVNPVGSAVIVDNSLTISGAAADAKIVGDKINDLISNDLISILANAQNITEELEWEDGYYWVPAGATAPSESHSRTKINLQYNETLIFIPKIKHPNVLPIGEYHENYSTLRVSPLVLPDNNKLYYTYTCLNQNGLICGVSDNNRSHGTFYIVKSPYFNNYENIKTFRLNNISTFGKYITPAGKVVDLSLYGYFEIMLRKGEKITMIEPVGNAVSVFSIWENNKFIKNIVSGDNRITAYEYICNVDYQTIRAVCYFNSLFTCFIKPVKNQVELNWIQGHYLGGGGQWLELDRYWWADLILKRGQQLTVTIHCNNVVKPLSIWTDDNKLMAVLEDPTTEDFYTFTYICTEPTIRLRLNTIDTYLDQTIAIIDDYTESIVTANTSIKDDYYQILFNNIICIGDSLTQGSYTGHDLHIENYPYFLQKLTGWNCTNGGRSGWTTTQWWNGSASEQKGFPYYSYSNYDTAIIFLGTNGGLTDTLNVDTAYESYNNYADTNTGNYCKIIEGMLEQNSDIKIYLCNIFAGGGDSLEISNKVIKQIGQKYNLPVINLNISEFNIPRTVYHAQANIHLGRIGYAKLAQIIKMGIIDDVIKNTSKYNYIPSN